MSNNNYLCDLDELIQIYGDDVLRICYIYMKNKSYAEDAFQETFLKVYKKYHTFKGDCTIKTWIIRIAINTCKDMLRSQWLKRIILKETIQDDFYTIEEAIIEKISKKKLQSLIYQLPTTYKDVILLYYYEELSIKEISAILEIPESRVKNRLYRGRHLVKAYIEKTEGNSHEEG